MNVLAKKIAALLLLGFSLLASPMYADWDPEYCFPDEDLSSLDDLIFQNLKLDMVNYLKGSWCSEEKINLLNRIAASEIKRNTICIILIYIKQEFRERFSLYPGWRTVY